MPDIFGKVFGYHIYFWSNEGDPIEPVHFHISKHPHKNATKYWVLRDGTLRQDNNNDNISSNDLKRIIRFMALKSSIARVKSKWIDHFGELSYLQ